MGKQIKKIQKNKENALNLPWKEKWENGRVLILKVTKQLRELENMNNVLNVQLQSAKAIIGALTVQLREHSKDEIVISKALIRELVEKYQVSSNETEDKLGYIIAVKEIENIEQKSGQGELENDEGADKESDNKESTT